MPAQRLAVHLLRKPRRHILKHHQQNQQRIPRRPGSRLVAQQPELHRQRPPMTVDVAVHPCRVGLQLRPLIPRQLRHGPVRRRPHLQNPLPAVMLHHGRSQNFRQLARAMSSQRIHLPQPVARGHIPLRKQGIVQTARRNRRHTLRIARHRHRRPQSPHRRFAVQPRQSRIHRMTQARGPHQQTHAQQHRRRTQPLQNAPHIFASPNPAFSSLRRALRKGSRPFRKHSPLRSATAPAWLARCLLRGGPG